jgi:osmotically-inducible protein OsmY
MCAWVRLVLLSGLLYATTCSAIYTNPIDNFNNGATNNYLKTMLTYRISTDPKYSSSNVTVDSIGTGGVVFKGDVPDDGIAYDLIVMAESYPTTTSVSTMELDIATPTQKKVDVYTAAMVAGLCLRKMIFSPQDFKEGLVKVTALDQIVTFSGVAHSQFQIDRAIEAAKTLSFVRKVKSTMTVR